MLFFSSFPGDPNLEPGLKNTALMGLDLKLKNPDLAVLVSINSC